MSNFEKSEHNKKIIMRFALMQGEGLTEDELRAYTDNEIYLNSVMTFRRAFPDYRIHIEDMTAEGDFVILHGVCKGTHTGDLHGIPASYRRIELPMMVKYQIIDDKIVNAWPMYDQLDLFEQLGAIHKPG